MVCAVANISYVKSLSTTEEATVQRGVDYGPNAVQSAGRYWPELRASHGRCISSGIHASEKKWNPNESKQVA
jgi:hypothetical protein